MRELETQGFALAQLQLTPDVLQVLLQLVSNILTLGGTTPVTNLGGDLTQTLLELQSHIGNNSTLGVVSVDGAGVGNAIFLQAKASTRTIISGSEFGGAPVVPLEFTQGVFKGVSIDRTQNSNNGGVGLAGPAAAVTGTGHVRMYGDTVHLIDPPRAPANSAAAGNDGEITWDNAGNLYFHSNGQWWKLVGASF